MNREIRFDLIYQGDTGFHHKKYHIEELMGGIRNICDIHDMMRLVAIRQYTGVKDKNGVEIYEGDIIKYWDGTLTANPNGDIYYPEINPNFFRKSDHVAKEVIFRSPSFALKNKPVLGSQYVGEKEIEIIGNIYEHGYLLEN